MRSTVEDKPFSSSTTSNRRQNKVIHTRVRSKQSKTKFNCKINPEELHTNHRPLTNSNTLSIVWSSNKEKCAIDDYLEHRRRKQNKNLRRCRRVLLTSCCIIVLATLIAALLIYFLTKKPNTTTTTTSTIVLTSTNEVVYSVWNTFAGQNSTLSSPGNDTGTYNPSEIPQNIFDQNLTTKYTTYGNCNRFSSYSPQCGVNTGFYVSLQRGAVLLKSVRFCTTNTRPERDPATITIEGSNQPSARLLSGSSWTLLYNGSSGLDLDPGRTSYGTMLTISNNLMKYQSYRFLITSIRNMSNSVSYSEVELYGF